MGRGLSCRRGRWGPWAVWGAVRTCRRTREILVGVLDSQCVFDMRFVVYTAGSRPTESAPPALIVASQSRAAHLRWFHVRFVSL